MTEEALAAAQAEFAAAEATREKKRIRRHNVIQDCIEENMRDVDIARVTGLGKERVRQIRKVGRLPEREQAA